MRCGETARRRHRLGDTHLGQLRIVTDAARVVVPAGTRVGLDEQSTGSWSYAGLVSLAVNDEDLLPKAYEVADRLANGSQSAISWTKYALNNWLRQAGPAFDASLALEFMGFAGPDVREGLASLRERRPPAYGPKA